MLALTPGLRIAFRNVRTRPTFSLMVIGMLALGVAVISSKRESIWEHWEKLESLPAS